MFKLLYCFSLIGFIFLSGCASIANKEPLNCVGRDSYTAEDLLTMQKGWNILTDSRLYSCFVGGEDIAPQTMPCAMLTYSDSWHGIPHAVTRFPVDGKLLVRRHHDGVCVLNTWQVATVPVSEREDGVTLYFDNVGSNYIKSTVDVFYCTSNGDKTKEYDKVHPVINRIFS
jgi:hypothetical protein